MLKLFRKKPETVDEVMQNHECKILMERVSEMYSKDMTGLIIIVEKDKQSYGHCAGMEPAQAILSLDQFHHRVQHEGLNNYG